MAGKGSAPRKGANLKAYSSNWDKIFNNKSEERAMTSGEMIIYLHELASRLKDPKLREIADTLSDLAGKV